jgi:hypothetical protein
MMLDNLRAAGAALFPRQLLPLAFVDPLHPGALAVVGFRHRQACIVTRIDGVYHIRYTIADP